MNKATSLTKPLPALAGRAKAVFALLFILLISVTGYWLYTMKKTSTTHTHSSNWQAGKFVNSHNTYDTHISSIWKIARAYLSADRKAPVPTQAMPLVPLTQQQLLTQNDDAVYRLGHSTILMKLDSQFVLTDPVFSERASPFSFAGPKRFHQSPIAMEDLPMIDVVVISHDHYDHLDKHAIKAMHGNVKQFITPLGIGTHLKKWGVPAEKITELDWWQTHTSKRLNFTATPTQHFSGRGLFDRDTTLWASWVIASKNSKIFFSERWLTYY